MTFPGAETMNVGIMGLDFLRSILCRMGVAMLLVGEPPLTALLALSSIVTLRPLLGFPLMASLASPFTG